VILDHLYQIGGRDYYVGNIGGRIGWFTVILPITRIALDMSNIGHIFPICFLMFKAKNLPGNQWNRATIS